MPQEETNSRGFLRNAVAVFEGPDSLAPAVEALRQAGIGVSQLSLIAPGRYRAQAAALLCVGCEAQDPDPGDTPCRPLVAFDSQDGGLCSMGLLSGPLAELPGRDGSDLRAGLSHWLPQTAACALQREIDAKHLLLWVNLRDAQEEKRACAVLLSYSQHTVQIHDLRVDL